MSGDARVAQEAESLIGELVEWAERFHHMAINCHLLAMDGEGTRGPLHMEGMGAAYGNASEFIYNRIRQIREEFWTEQTR